eukprot:GFKZ01000957.1.p2 GENE.GFKZ01000957.1~~GFKZ01000957.1.p2  ORF type:complete len:122 (-),score=17.62 GFKZ01000957.1:247-612(-)
MHLKFPPALSFTKIETAMHPSSPSNPHASLSSSPEGDALWESPNLLRSSTCPLPLPDSTTMHVEKVVRFASTSQDDEHQPSPTRRASLPRVPTPHPRDFARHILASDAAQDVCMEGKEEHK